MPSLFKKLTFSLIAFAIILGAVELTLNLLGISPAFQNRFFLLNRNYDYPEVFRRDADLFWTLRGPQTVTSDFFAKGEYRINSRGMRGDEISDESGVTRIALIGNSCSFGWQVSEEQIFLPRLVEQLNNNTTTSQFTEFEGINGGIPGYTSFQGRRFFERDIADYKPSFTLIMFGWNDQWAAAGNISDAEQQPPSELIVSFHNAVNRLRLYQILRSAFLSASEPALSEMLVKGNMKPRVSLTEFRDNLLAISRKARQIGSVPILLTSPIPQLETYYPPNRYSPMHTVHENYNLVARRLAFDENIEIVDLASEFDTHSDLFDDAGNDTIHFNVAGHALAADLIAERMKLLLSADSSGSGELK